MAINEKKEKNEKNRMKKKKRDKEKKIELKRETYNQRSVTIAVYCIYIGTIVKQDAS